MEVEDVINDVRSRLKGHLIIGEPNSGKTLMAMGASMRYSHVGYFDCKLKYNKKDDIFFMQSCMPNTDLIIFDDADMDSLHKALEYLVMGVYVKKPVGKPFLIHPDIIVTSCDEDVIDTSIKSIAIQRRFKIIETKVVTK